MSISTTTRQANVAEIAAEMDRRGRVIEQLEARLAHIDGIYRGAIDNLQHHQRQLDQDGIEVAVSRQALWEVLAGVEAALAQPAAQEGWRPMESAPKDGTIVRLLVHPSTSEGDGWTPFSDSLDPYGTIGFNNLADTEEDQWQFAGWNWSQDCFIDGAGTVIGWLPFYLPAAPSPEQGEAL